MNKAKWIIWHCTGKKKDVLVKTAALWWKVLVRILLQILQNMAVEIAKSQNLEYWTWTTEIEEPMKKTVKLGRLLSSVCTQEEIEEAIQEIPHDLGPQSHDIWQVIKPMKPKEDGSLYVWHPKK
ncbi:MAG: hypothetical protein HN975_02125 [Anaerolineae bacterium]|jgi:hypothetical protein|nr:hypothetical protein [Anaerolineae bacterium]